MAIRETIKSLAQSRIMQVVAGAIAVLAVAAVAIELRLFRALVHSPWRWEILAAVIALAVFALIFWGIPWFQEWRFVHRESSQYPIAGERSPQEFQAKFARAVHKLRSLPHHNAERDPLYAIPWYLILGGQAGKTTALAAAGVFSPLTSIPAEGGTQNCDWWVSNSMLMLDTAGRYVTTGDIARDRPEWYRLLHAIRHYHGQEPISGIVVAVAADELASSPAEKLAASAGKIRERIEEAIDTLRQDFPIYLLVTKCDLMEGFAEFFGVFPPQVLEQTVGYVDDPPTPPAGAPQRGEEALRRLQTGLRGIYERLNVLRLSILNGNVAEPLKQAVFCFPEEVRALQAPLTAFAEPLLSDDVRFHTPLFRGVFFASAKQEGSPFSSLRSQLHLQTAPAPPEHKTAKPYFLQDLFETVIPRDRALSVPLN